jgi:hypothetical protein
VAIRAYNSPGVSISETLSPALASLLASPSLVAIVGAASGEQSATERLVLTGTTAVDLAHTGVTTNTVVVKLGTTGETLNAGNYVITAGTDPDATVTGDEPYTIKRFGLPLTAPTVSNAGTGTLTGTYQYAITFVNATGETGAGPASSNVTLSTQGTNLTAIPVGPTGTTARNIYRQKIISGEGQGYHLVATISNNTVTILSNETTSDVTASSAAAPPTGIADGDTVVVTYDYVDDNYFEPTLLDNFDDIVAKYGAPFDANGNVGSPLTFAARIAFLNGAREIIAVAASANSAVAIEDALIRLEDEEDVRFVVAASGDTAVNGAVVTHCAKMNGLGQYRQGIVGQDGSSTVIPADTLRAAAKGINSEPIIHVSPSSFWLENPVTGRRLNVGSQYVAAGAAGMFAARDPQVAVTRLVIAGFNGYNDKRTQADFALDSAAGLFVIENKGGTLRVRHGVTTAVGNVATAESSVVRAKYEMAHRLREVLDSSLVGKTTSVDQAPLLVSGATLGVLDQVTSEGIISGYSNVNARILVSDPTTVEVRFSYAPQFPINNINIIFTIDTNTGNFNLT